MNNDLNNGLPLPDLHQRIMGMTIDRDTGDEQYNDFYCLLTTYKYNTTPDRFYELATTCERRLMRLVGELPIDLINAYHRLARLAHWRATQLETPR